VHALTSDSTAVLLLLLLLCAYLSLNVLQVLLLLDRGQVRHVEPFADAFASQLCSIGFLHHNPDKPKATFTKCSA
jgi:hypothetical protein